MTQFIRNLILVMLGMTLFVGLVTAGLFIGLSALAAAAVFWIYVKLRAKGIIKGKDPREGNPSGQIEIIDAEYTVINEKETQEREDRV